MGGFLYDGCDDLIVHSVLMKLRLRMASLGSDDTNFVKEDTRVGFYETIGYDKYKGGIRETAY